MTGLIPSHLKYTREHEWVLVEGKTITVGISGHAQQQLGDVVYLELPEVGQKISKNKVFGVIESVKAVSDLFSPVSGKVIESNNTLIDQPEIINQDPYQAGWLIKVHASNLSEINDLMDSEAYKMYLKEYVK